MTFLPIYHRREYLLAIRAFNHASKLCKEGKSGRNTIKWALVHKSNAYEKDLE